MIDRPLPIGKAKIILNYDAEERELYPEIIDVGSGHDKAYLNEALHDIEKILD